MEIKREITGKLIRCPKLGDEMTLSYCLQESGELPCTRIMRCWSSFIDVESLLKEKLTPDKRDNFVNIQSKDKVVSLIELIEAVKSKK
jgi:hypothetical protein